MLKIGITGGIGSGKTTVCKIFEQLGIPIYYADTAARELMNTDLILVEGVKKEFGDVYDANGMLNRPKLAQIVFNDKQKLQQLNAMVHPAVQRGFKQWAEKQNNVAYVMKEAALMYESGSYKDVDYMITVSAPEEMRIERVVTRDNVNAEEVQKRIKNQLSEEERLERADFIIKNDGTEALIPQVMELHEKFIEASQPLS